MANGTYSRSGGYRNDRMRDERDFARQSDDYRPGDTGYGQSFGEYESGRDDGYGGRDYGRREDVSRQSRYGAADDWGRDERSQDRTYGDDDRSRLWARESYRANPSSFSYEPGRSSSHQPFDQSSAYGRRSGSGARGHDDRFRGSENDDRRGFMQRAGDEVASWFGDEQAEQRRAMDHHRGKGPKGYQRSDGRIEEDVNDRLSDDPILDASNINVTVKEGEVTLDGFVSSRLDKRRAEDIVDDVSGVRHVQNNLRVTAASTGTVTGSTTL